MHVLRNDNYIYILKTQVTTDRVFIWGLLISNMSDNKVAKDHSTKNVDKTHPRNNTMTITERGATALLKKFSKTEMSDARGLTRARLLSRFVNELASKQFGAIVFGYEMVLQDSQAGHIMPLKEINKELERLLHKGIIIGIASSRNHETVKTELQHTILPEYWKTTHVGYCNGANIGTLDDDDNFQNNKDEHLELFFQCVTLNNIIPKSNIIKYQHQISIKNDNKIYSAENIFQKIKSIDKSILNGIKILESGKFIDVIPHYVSKYNIINTIKKSIPKDRHILCIGYDGQWPGSDCELLTHRYSLSTNTVSATAATCWNLLPDDVYGEQGTLAYLKNVEIKGDSWFSISI